MNASATTLEACIEQFRLTDLGGRCATPVGAYANCYAASMRFAQLLRRRGVACAVMHVSGMLTSPARGVGRWPLANPRLFGHWVVRVDDVTVDWTARQFDPDAAWPMITSSVELTFGWEQVQVWACERCDLIAADERHLDPSPAGLDRAQRQAALATGGEGPFSDPRHDRTAALLCPCRCQKLDDALSDLDRPVIWPAERTRSEPPLALA